MSDGTYQRTKRANGVFIVRPVVKGNLAALPGQTFYYMQDKGWRRMTKDKDGNLRQNVRNVKCPCGSGKRVKRCYGTAEHERRSEVKP